MIPLRVIMRDAIDEYGWKDLPDPFAGLKLPKVRKIRIHPFSFEEWVARTLGHVDTSMVYRTYSQYVPNLTRQDGLALEEMFNGTINKKATRK
jgi:hypothetical protein